VSGIFRAAGNCEAGGRGFSGLACRGCNLRTVEGPKRPGMTFEGTGLLFEAVSEMVSLIEVVNSGVDTSMSVCGAEGLRKNGSSVGCTCLHKA
jgi:hypothetical protein